MLEINVNSRTPASITGAFRKIKEMVSTGAISKETKIHVTLENGTYCETVKYNLPNPLVMESASGLAEKCVIQADNCEAFNKSVINRSVFIFGPNVTSAELRNISVINTHLKNPDENANQALDSAEALAWNNINGILKCSGVRIEGRKNTLSLRGNSLFRDSFISGDVDFIYGETKTALFEHCQIHVREDNRGDFNGFAVNSQALADGNGFVFIDCAFTCDERKKASVYAARTDGKGSAYSPNNWDNIAFVNCTFDRSFSEDLVFDDDMNLKIYPRGNARSGIREYRTKVVDQNGKISDADTTLRESLIYTLTDDDYSHGYASRYLMLHDTPFFPKR